MRRGRGTRAFYVRKDAAVLEDIAASMQQLGAPNIGHAFPAATWPSDVTEALRQALQQAAHDLRMHAAGLEDGGGA